jgi:hypothetical protein
MLVGACIVFYQSNEICFANLRAEESASAARAVRELGERAEAQFKRTRTVPSEKELNCGRPPCDQSAFLPTRFVRVDSNGVIHAEYHKLGQPFSPFRNVVAKWDSFSRVADQDRFASPWFWRLRPLGWLIVGAALLLAPWHLKICGLTARYTRALRLKRIAR